MKSAILSSSSFSADISQDSFSMSFERDMPDQTSSSKYSPNLLSQHLREVFESMTAESSGILSIVKLDVTRFHSDVLNFENFESLLIPRRGCKALTFWVEIIIQIALSGLDKNV